MRNAVKAQYGCAQKDLYSVCRTGWENYLTYVADFGAKKAFYIDAIATAALAAVDAAEALPDAYARTEDSRTLHVELVKAGLVCTDDFQLVKSYIDSAYAEDLRTIKYDAAGQNYYAAATEGDWESVSNLNVSMLNFLNDHSAELEDGDNMPATFIATVMADKAAFKLTYEDFKVAEETGVSSDAKVSANNACYVTLTDMFRDGQKYFKGKPEFDLFVFAALLEMINPTTGSFTGKVTETNFTGIGGVTLTLSKSGVPPIIATTDEEGSFSIGRLSGGDYAVVLSKTGYTNVTDSISIETGTGFSKDYVMASV